MKYQKTKRKQKQPNQPPAQKLQHAPLSPDVPVKLVLSPKKFEPKGKNQIAAKRAWKEGKHLFLHGFPGTGKTYIATALAVEEIRNPDSPIDKIVFCRSSVQGRDQGFIKGDVKEKMAEFETPFIEAINTIYDSPLAYDYLTKTGVIQFISTSFQRGTNIANAVLILDEIQNFSFMEAHTLFTRPKDATRVIVAGDTGQDDLTNERKKETSGLRQLSRIIDGMGSFARFEFTVDDVLRSAFVKEYLIAKERIENPMEDEKKPKRQMLLEIPDEENEAVVEVPVAHVPIKYGLLNE